MSDIVLSVENLWKQYRLGVVGSGSIKDDIARWWARIRGKEDPTLKIGAINDRENIDSEYVWALQDINFEVKRGEVLGIIGKNGAGKSTLLKILSKVTTPTKGHIKTKGRIASLLEVGTGFHPELTGRENIYLNGAILGMDKNYINSRFDEIVEFSGIGKYIDTPVKRYSSGMYVRLAFAVAAHLEPEILIIDEVLAVGDAEFQKKCLGKMKDVSGEGRTVLFVSHALESIKKLCTKGLLMKYGKLDTQGNIGKVIGEYMKKNADMQVSGIIPLEAERGGLGEARFKSVNILNKENELTKHLFFKQDIEILLVLEVFESIKQGLLGVCLTSNEGEKIAILTNDKNVCAYEVGKYEIKLLIPNIFLQGDYSLNISMSHYPSGSDIDYVERVYDFTIDKLAYPGQEEYAWTKHGHIFLDVDFRIKKLLENATK